MSEVWRERLVRLRRLWHECVHAGILVEHPAPGRLVHRCLCGAVLGETHGPASVAVPLIVTRTRRPKPRRPKVVPLRKIG